MLAMTEEARAMAAAFDVVMATMLMTIAVAAAVATNGSNDTGSSCGNGDS